MSDQELLAICNERFRYDERSGKLYVKTRYVDFVELDDAGMLSDVSGYRTVAIRGNKYLAHRIIWLMVHGSMPSGQIKHINGKRDDNRIANLCLASQAESGK